MQSPFTDYTGTQQELNDTMELPFQNPLVDPLTIQKESTGYDDRKWYRSETSFAPVMEAELSTQELATAMNVNTGEMVTLKWVDHLSAIIEKLKTITGIDARQNYQRDIQYDVLAKAIDRYQEMKGIKAPVKGAMGVATWSALQDDLGFLNYDKYKKFDLEKAIKANAVYKNRFWGNHTGFIIKLFQAKGFIRHELQLDDKYFAIMVARWQSQNDILKDNPKNSDGILGPVSWDIMRTEIESRFPAYEIKAHIQGENTAEAARRFVEVMRNLGITLGNSYSAIENKIDASLRNEKQESSLVREGIYLVADAIMDFIGESKVGKVPAALGKIALGLVKKYYEEKEENERRQYNIVISHTLSDLILTAKNAATFLPEQTVTKHQLDDILNHAFPSDKKGRSEEFAKFLDLIIDLEETVRDSNKIYRIALSRLMNMFSLHTRVVVHCQNQKDIDDWTESDIYNISTDPDRQRLFLRFSRIHQYVNAESDSLTSNQRKILRQLWQLWNERNYPLRQMLLDKHVIFRVHLMETVAWMQMPVPYDVYIKTLKKGEELWTDATDILGRRDSSIQFYSYGKSKSKQLEERNSNGLTYKYIILSIVNTVMKNEFNKAYSSKQVGFVEKENENRISDTYASQGLIGNELAEVEQETLAVVFPKQTILTGSVLSVKDNAKATSANKIGLQRSGLQLATVLSALGKYIDITTVRQALSSYNQKEPGHGYAIDNTSTTPDSVFTEAVHQFQLFVYIDPKQHDGILGRSTLESLGFIEHGLKQKVDSRMFYGQAQLDRRDVKDEVSKRTSGKYTANNWFQFLLKPSWLGVPITDGVHILLLEKLREAESWLLNQPQYKNLTPSALGRALGFKPDSRYSAARLSSGKQAMHGFGLAIDINVPGNPWIGAGWIVNDKVLLQERYRMISALRKASGNNSLPGETVFAYLHSIAQSAGNDTSKAYGILKQRNDEFIAYLRTNSSELAYWKNSQTFGGRNPLNGFLNLHPDLVYALRHVAGLAWGAMDFGPRASGDIMHFDLRTQGVGKFLCEKIGGYVPSAGHPAIQKETGVEHFLYEEEDRSDETDMYPVHEAVEEALESDESPFDVQSNNETERWNVQYEGDFEDNSAYEDQYVSTDFEDGKDWSQAVRLNNRYASQLGWGDSINQVNQLLLPFSGMQDVSLGEEAFAKALAEWQKSKGFSESDSDGILGPHTWSVMKPLLVPSVSPSVPGIITGPAAPDVSNIAEYNQWHAQKIVDSMNNGTIGENFNSKSQLEKLSRGEQVLNVNPQNKIVRILPVMYHIAKLAQENNYNDIIFGSFIRKPDSNGSCTGHCAGICIDINYKKGTFDTNGSIEMVKTILTYLLSLPSFYKGKLGFGMPLQGGFFGNNPYAKYKKQPASNLISRDLQVLVPQLGIVFPDNPNHLHIQVVF